MSFFADNIVDLAWEPNGNKLVVLTVSETVTYVNFFSGRPGNKFELISEFSLSCVLVDK